MSALMMSAIFHEFWIDRWLVQNYVERTNGDYIIISANVNRRTDTKSNKWCEFIHYFAELNEYSFSVDVRVAGLQCEAHFECEP